MKTHWKILILACGALVSFSAGSLVTDSGAEGDKRTALIMREIGHRLLLHSGDSSSRILPIHEAGKNNFQISFQSKFKFVPDSLVKIVQKSMAQGQLPSNYVVSVFDQSSLQIVYGFEMRGEEENIIPCLGRPQPIGNYIIQVTFPEDKNWASSSTVYYLFFGFSAIGLLVAFTNKRFFPFSPVAPKKVEEEKTTTIKIGKYDFCFEQKSLHFNTEIIPLSDKESDVLKILSTHSGELVSRDHLMKEVWENEGVFVGRSLDVFISRLRKKFQDDPSVKITNVHGKGYRLEQI